jgi:DNA repair photolyase
MVRYEVVECSSALTRVQGMPFHWSLNPYRGCVHGCHYCYARRYHGFLELDAGEDFASVIFVKGNLPQVLRRELRRPGWARETVALGTGTDPYQAIEGRFCLTRDSLRALADYGTPASIVTKGTLILRDLVELCRLQEAASVVLCFSLTSLRPEVWRRLEPGAPPPHQRLKVLAKLVDAGIQAGVFLAPILP